MTQLRHFDHLNTARFVTFSCFHRFRLLTSPAVIEVFLEELDGVRNRHGLKLYGYVVMPEHVHLVLWPPDTVKLGVVIGQLKSLSARRMLPLLRVQRGTALDRLEVRRSGEGRLVFWQIRCYDHNCRTPEIVREKIEYCHKNPVVRGLVSDPAEWRWSSYNWYLGCTDVPISMDEADS
jgi:putative transposase